MGRNTLLIDWPLMFLQGGNHEYSYRTQELPAGRGRPSERKAHKGTGAPDPRTSAGARDLAGVARQETRREQDVRGQRARA